LVLAIIKRFWFLIKSFPLPFIKIPGQEDLGPGGIGCPKKESFKDWEFGPFKKPSF